MFDFFDIIRAVKAEEITFQEAEERFTFLITNEKQGKTPIGYWDDKVTLWDRIKDEIVSAGVGQDIRFFYSLSIGFCLDSYEDELEEGDAVIVYERILSDSGIPLEDLRSVEDIAEMVANSRVSKEDAETYIRVLLTKEIGERDSEDIAFVHPDGAEYPERLWLWIGELFLKGKITGVKQVWMDVNTKKLEFGPVIGEESDMILLF